MKNVFSAAALLILLTAGAVYSDILLNLDKNDDSGQKYILVSTKGEKQVQKDVYLVGTDQPNINRVVYIFHGYKPAGDSYQQSPVYFIVNWKLSELSQKYGVLFVLPDNGASVYPVTKINDPLSDMSMMNALKKEIENHFKAAKIPLSIGFSAGVEGAMKFAILNDIPEIMAISGNYDLYHLPAGERAFHMKDFGPEKDVLEKENPITLLKKSPRTIYLFCEEKNAVNMAQAQTLVDAALPNIKLIDLRSLGKGYKHDWNFLTSPGITRNLEKIISGDVENLVTTQD